VNARTQRVILIDPVERSVRAVDSDGTIEHMQALIGTEHLQILRVNDGDMLISDEAPAADDVPFAIGAGTIIYGRAVIAYGGNIVMYTPKLPLEIAQEVVTFSTTPNPE
jgi:hypothetical protein